MKTATNIKVFSPIRVPRHNSFSVYHACPYCGAEDWGSVFVDEKERVVECDECDKQYILRAEK